MTDEPIQFGGSPHRLKGWLVLLLRETTKHGLAPLSQDRLHLLLFYCAVLAPVHSADQPVPKILKYGDLPFYPEAQDVLTKLVVDGFVEAGTRRSISDQGWDHAGYGITADGIRVSELLKASHWGRRTAAFVADLVSSFADLDPDTAEQIISQDATFRDDRLRKGEIRDLRQTNEAADMARFVADYEVDGLRPGPRESIGLYFDYLVARRAA
jgi:hypothetical protein